MRAFAVRISGFLMVFFFSHASWGQSEVGTVASAVGTVEIQREGTTTWQPILAGALVLPSDRIRTASAAAAKIVFVDDSVLYLAEATEVVVERFEVTPEAKKKRVSLRLFRGKLAALSAAAPMEAVGRYEIETPTAFVAVRSGKIIVHHSEDVESTDVVSLTASAEVQAKIGVIGQTVKIVPNQMTRVAKDRFPTQPSTPSAESLAAYGAGLFLIGTGTREGVEIEHPLMRAKVLRPEDQLEAIAPASLAPRSYLAPGVPGETLAAQISPDVRAIDQPIPEYRAAIPGESPTGGVSVDF
jgi:hypothetical protein